jgi:hypothetical protein
MKVLGLQNLLFCGSVVLEAPMTITIFLKDIWELFQILAFLFFFGASFYFMKDIKNSVGIESKMHSGFVSVVCAIFALIFRPW